MERPTRLPPSPPSLMTRSRSSPSEARDYPLCAADEAFRDANWMPSGYKEKERMGISIAKGIESMSTS
ncbi:unnamed protein product [Urochloa humidicola]